MLKLVEKLVLFSIFWPLQSGSVQALEVDGDYYALDSHFEYLVDPGGQLTLEDVVSGASKDEFTSLRHKKLEYGAEPVWLKIDLSFSESVSTSRYLLMAQVHNFFDLRLYRPDVNGNYDEWITGLDYPSSTREVPALRYSFVIDPTPHTTTVYLRFIGGMGANKLPWTLVEENFQRDENRKIYMIVAVCLSVIATMLCFNIILALTLRAQEYLYYCGYMLCVFLTLTILEGLSFYYFWPDLPILNKYALMVVSLVSPAFRLLAILYFLDIAKWAPRWHWASMWVLGLLAIALVLVTFGGLNTIPQLGVGSWLLGILFGLILCGRGVQLGIPLALPLFVTLLLPNIAALVQAYGNINSPTRNMWLAHSAEIGSALHVLLLSVCVAAKIKHNNDLRESQLESARAQAEASSEAKTLFLATMSHEIRTPMNGVVGLIDVLRRTELDEEQTELIDTVNDSSFALLEIIDDILDFSKVEAGKIELEEVPTSFERVLDGVGETLLQLALKKNVELITLCSPDLPMYHADSVRIRQILYNIVGNAIKFTHTNDSKQGRVVVTITGDVSEKQYSNIKIQVKDNGIGISPEALETLFEPFTQAETSTTRSYGGTGLGLSISKRLTELIGGNITISSDVGVGTVFTIVLPLRVSTEKPKTHRFNFNGQCVLLPGDDTELTVYLEKYLNSAGAKVSKYSDREMAALEFSPSTDLQSFTVVVLESQCDAPETNSLIAHLRQQLSDINSLNFVLLSPGRRRHIRSKDGSALQLDFNALRRSTFLRAIERASMRDQDEAQVKSAEAIVLATHEEDLPAYILNSKQKVLVAEDNKVNQKVIAHQMDVLCLSFDMASDGAEALSLWRSNPQRYALVLTDCHMPNMDGYELTREIRNSEPDHERLPIIAVTADALVGSDRSCINAGMDAYLRKPVQVALLKNTLKQWWPGEATGSALASNDSALHHVAPAIETSIDSGQSIMNESALPTLLGSDDKVLLTEFYQDFLTQALPIVEAILKAADGGELQEVAALAHKLKGSAASVGATAVHASCLQLEATSSDSEGIPDESRSALINNMDQARAWILINYPPE